MSLVNAPVGLRLFESSNSPLIADLNRILQWQTTIIGRFLDCGNHQASLEQVTITDNLDDKAWRLSAAQAGLISKETGFSPLGIDVREEGRRIIDEQMNDQREQAKAQQEMQMEQMSIGTQESDADGSGGAAGETSVDDLQSQADEWVNNLLSPNMTDTTRRQQLANLRQANPTLHALITQKLRQARTQAGTMGRDVGLQRMGIGQPQQAKTASAAHRSNPASPGSRKEAQGSVGGQKRASSPSSLDDMVKEVNAGLSQERVARMKTAAVEAERVVLDIQREERELAEKKRAALEGLLKEKLVGLLMMAKVAFPSEPALRPTVSEGHEPYRVSCVVDHAPYT